jgi:hypothetical protein
MERSGLDLIEDSILMFSWQDYGKSHKYLQESPLILIGANCFQIVVQQL